MSGTKTAIFPDVDFAWFPLGNPGLVSIPFSFLCGFLATIFSKPEQDKAELSAEMEVRAISGIGART